MSCSNLFTLKGLAMNCDPNIGGIKAAWFGQRSDFDVTPETGDTFTASIALASGAQSGVSKMQKYEFSKETGSLVSTQVVNEQNGTNYFQNVVNLVFNKMEGWKHLEISALAQSQLLGVILDTNGKYWIVGEDSYLSSIGSEIATTGVAADDRNGYTLALQANEAHLPYELADGSLTILA